MLLYGTLNIKLSFYIFTEYFLYHLFIFSIGKGVIEDKTALLPAPYHSNSLKYPSEYPYHSQKLNHKPSKADGTPKESPFNMNFNKMESDANYTHWQDMNLRKID